MKEYKGDKRKKEYKIWKEHQGIGDTVEAILHSKPLEPITKAIKNALWDKNEDCNCNKRKEKLNEIFPYRRKPQRCLTEQQFEQYKLYRKSRTLNVWNESEIHLLIKLYAHVFAIQYNANTLCRSCSGSGKKLRTLSKDLDKIYNTYEKDLQDLKMK